MEATRLHLLQQNMALVQKDEADEAEAQKALEEIRARTLDLLKTVEEKSTYPSSTCECDQ